MPDDDFSEDDPSVPWNLRDVYEMGDDETKRRLEDEAQELSDDLRSSIDQNQLRVVRTGGHMVRVRDGDGACEVQVCIYRTGPKYGYWNFSHSPEGHEVHIAHHLPTSYGDDGAFDTTTLDKSWTLSALAWRQHSSIYLKRFVGTKIAEDVGLVFHLPPTVAPDALI